MHYVEEHARVYLRLSEDGKRWVVDGPFDGYGVDGYDNGPVNANCECGAAEVCDEARDAAALHVPLPGLLDLAVGILQALASQQPQQAKVSVVPTRVSMYADVNEFAWSIAEHGEVEVVDPESSFVVKVVV